MKVSRDVECSLRKDLEGFALLIWKRSTVVVTVVKFVSDGLRD